MVPVRYKAWFCSLATHAVRAPRFTARSISPSQEPDRSRPVSRPGLGGGSCRPSVLPQGGSSARLAHLQLHSAIVHTKRTHSNPPLQFSSPGLCLTRARAPPAQRPHDAERRRERRKGVGTHLPSVVVVNNYSQDESRHCPVFSLKTRHN